MVKHHPKLKRLWKNCEILSKIAHEQVFTETFSKELMRIVQKDLRKGIKEKRIGELWKELLGF